MRAELAAGSELARPPGVGRGLRWAWRYLRGGGRTAASASMAVGLFVGCLPLYGLHLPLVLAICLPLRLDAVLAYIAANISNPLVAPFLLLLEVQVGSMVLERRWLDLDADTLQRVGLGGLMLQTGVGALIVGAALAAIGALAAWPFSRGRAQPVESFDAALGRVLARYAKAPPEHRIYVPMKLLSDPLVPQLAALPGPFGDLLDVGSGRGQFGLLLLELGRTRSVSGFDWDERKVDVARLAAAGAARFEHADLRAAELPPSDTVLLLDVLHYVPRVEQRALLERVAACLRPGGRLVIRDAEPHAGLRGALTRGLERIATGIGYNRAGEVQFSSSAELVQQLEALGMSVAGVQHSGGLWLSNVLIVARRPEAC